MEPLTRPVAPPAWADRLRAWIAWFGVGRVVAAGVATVIVCAGAYWLVRAPMPPTETSLPIASTAVIASAAAGGPSTPASAPPAERVLVHVAGAVAEPGVYELAPGARVRDAVVAAGGPTADADWNALNLAAVVSDASRVYVPVVGENVPPDELGSSGAPAADGPVDVNRATAEELDELPGVGPATAAAIVTERNRNGPFVDVDDLDRVPGIGPAKLDALRDLVTT